MQLGWSGDADFLLGGVQCRTSAACARLRLRLRLRSVIARYEWYSKRLVDGSHKKLLPLARSCFGSNHIIVF